MTSDTSSAAPAPAPAMSKPPADAQQTLSNAGSFVVMYVTDPAPIPLNDMFAIDFWVQPMVAEGTAVKQLEIAVDARMPHHRHGMYRVPKVEALPDGHFRATGMLFHMPGYWEIYFDITNKGVTERAQFSVEID